MRIAATVLATLLLAGCFGSDGSLYGGVTPLQPFQSGPVTSRDKDGKVSHLTLAQDANGVYRLTFRDPGEDLGKGYRLRFFALDGAPSDMLVAEVKDCGADVKQCDSNSGWIYELVRKIPDSVEWRDPDCSKTFSKLSGVTVEIDSCKFSDRDSLEKALRVAASMPWKPDGSYLLH